MAALAALYPAKLQKVAAFDRFGQPTTTNGVRALDLGLPLAKQFVEAHGGAISLVSEIGVGTLVKAELPR